MTTTLDEAAPAASNDQRPTYNQTLADGWIVKHEWGGGLVRFECPFRQSDNPDREYIVAVLVFPASGEMRMDGPRRSTVRRDTVENVPPWCFLYAHERVRELLDSLRVMPEQELDDMGREAP